MRKEVKASQNDPYSHHMFPVWIKKSWFWWIKVLGWKKKKRLLPRVHQLFIYSDCRSRAAVWLAPWFVAVVILFFCFSYWGYNFPIGHKKRQKEFTRPAPSESNVVMCCCCAVCVRGFVFSIARAIDYIWHCWPRFPRPGALQNILGLRWRQMGGVDA